ncbi:MAG: hypothetical protein QF371_06185, partial [Flavobacteriales bacterium]|nr:hypothetical protein [Flavobacteriales bacterium]
GGKIGTTLSLKEWDKSIDGKKRLHQLFASPQVGVFGRPSNHISVIINADIGYRFMTKKDLYLSPSIGLGYMLSMQKTSVSVNLGTGKMSNTEREARHYFVPTGNLEVGHEALAKRLGWYLKFTYGGKLFSSVENAGMFAAELGIRIRLSKKPKQSADN